MVCNKILSCVQQSRCSPMLIFRAWATSGGTCVAEKDYLSASSIACVSRSALHARFALAFAFLKSAKEKVCFASYGNNFSRFSVDQIWLSRFERLALSSSQPFRRLLFRRISERSDDRKYVFVCRMVVCMTELLIYRPFQFYSEKIFEFTCKRLYHSASENSKKHFQLTQSKFATETS